MSKIHATCPRCGDQMLEDREVRLIELVNRPEASRYEFTCPGCLDRVVRPAEDWVIAKLVTTRVRHDRVRVPAEALETHHGPVITHDDLLDFRQRLDRGDLLAQLAAAPPVTTPSPADEHSLRRPGYALAPVFTARHASPTPWYRRVSSWTGRLCARLLA